MVVDGDSITVTHPERHEKRSWGFPRVFPLDVTQAAVFDEVRVSVIFLRGC